LAHGGTNECRCAGRDRHQHLKDQERTRSLALMMISAAMVIDILPAFKAHYNRAAGQRASGPFS